MRRHDDITCIMCGTLMNFEGHDYYRCPNCGNTAVGNADSISYAEVPPRDDEIVDPEWCETCEHRDIDFPGCARHCVYFGDHDEELYDW